MAGHAADQNERTHKISLKEPLRNNGIVKPDTTNMTKTTSLCTLIIWNITKALENNPSMNIKYAIRAIQSSLDRERDLNAMMSCPEKRHLACALLAWQQLGHNDADSLYQFIDNESKKGEHASPTVLSTSTQESLKSFQEFNYSKDTNSISTGSSFIGPVVRLPAETKIVMRLENSTCSQHSGKKQKAQDKDTMDKIEAACCFESECVERLAAMDTAITELRTRAAMLARREAERVELLERAEVAWRDLELGYQRRLTLAEEKEDELTKQIQKSVEERNGFKNFGVTLAKQLKEIGEKAENDRAILSALEAEVYDRACMRLQLSEEAAKGDAILAEQQCRASQLDRDLQFKEEHARRMLLNFQSELESSQTLTHDTERAMRAELSSLRDQIAQISDQLLGEDAENSRLQIEMVDCFQLEDLRSEKMGMVEDLEGCKAMCDSRMQGKVDELKKKTEQLAELKDKVTECRCKMPVDASVEVKRTVSLAALCRCKPEDKVLDSCSCTSLRSKMLSNLLADLFHGLQSEMGGTSTQMPCQLLKCLEDKHNWDRATIVKTNLRNYFDQLLIGELDIAISTSIEKYHAKWVGQSCADDLKMTPDPGEVETEGWQQRAIERRAQKLATQLAEQLFQERAEQLTQQARDIVTSGPPPCECKPQQNTATSQQCRERAAAYPVLIQQVTPAIGHGASITPVDDWRRAMRDVTKLKMQIENLKKESIKKEDLKLMEEKLTKIVQDGSGSGKPDFRVNTLNSNVGKRDPRYNRSMGSNQSNYCSNYNKPVPVKKKQVEISSLNKKGILTNSISTDKYLKPFRKHGQTYAINMCMCAQKDPNKIVQQDKKRNDSSIEDDKHSRNERVSKDVMLSMTSSVKQTKPINSNLQSQDISFRSNSKSSGQQSSCQSNCVCFHKVPSNTSIDKLLEMLAKCKNEMSTLENVIEDATYGNLNENKTIVNKPFIFSEKNNINDTSGKEQKEDIKSDIKESPVVNKSNLEESTANTNNSHNQANKTLHCDCPVTSRKSKQYDNVINSFKSNLSKEVCCGSKINTEKSCTETEIPAPRTTESEYMGAINLDKSNEDFCKCIEQNGNTTRKTEEPESYKNESGKSLKIQSVENLVDRASFDQTPQEKNNISILQNSKLVEPASKETKINKNRESFPCDCGYDIKFLGVTLTDVNPRNEMKGETNNDKRISKSLYYSKIEGRPNIMKRNNDIIDGKNNLDVKYGNNDIQGCQENSDSASIKQQQSIDKFNIIDKDMLIPKRNSKNIQNTAPFSAVSVDLDDSENNITHTNKDKSVDVQSLNDYTNKIESCICCAKQPFLEDSKDLEENAFQLLEDHLRKKLEKFKNSSCNSTCIPPEEEEKLFSKIIQRVKQVISESTNKLTCKCSSEDQTSGGSWNRAYGLLQEYLKTKIKRVQCSCVEPESNGDTVLPELLGKVCNLIEHDFQRLQDVCDCKNSHELKDKYNKQVYFKEEVPERDTGFPNRAVTVMSCQSQNPQTSTVEKENISAQVSAYLGMETKSCNPIETYTKIIQTLEQAQETLKSLNIQECDCSEKAVDAELLGTNKVEHKELKELSNEMNDEINTTESAQFSNKPYIGFVSQCACTDTECTDTAKLDISNDKTDTLNNNGKRSADAELLGCNESKQLNNQKSSVAYKNIYLCTKTNSSPCCEMTENIKINVIKSEKNLTCFDNVAHFQNNAYVGYTIDCSCDNALGTCVCTKSILKSVNNNVITSLWQKYMPNDQYYDKVSYILKSNPTTDKTYETDENNIVGHTNTNLNEELRKDRETENICDENVFLIKSKEYFDMAHTMTNTIDDDMSIATDYSNTEAPLDWCDCCSQIPHQDLKHSIYFPAPLEGFDNHLDSDIEKVNPITKPNSIPKHCDCDMVPICHVKMLVENIENKLVTAKCTCDSMNPKVCPIHSLQ